MPTIKQIDRVINNYQDDVQIIQDEYFQVHNKYQRIDRLNNLDYVSVDELDYGRYYQIRVFATEPDSMYFKIITYDGEFQQSPWQKYAFVEE